MTEYDGVERSTTERLRQFLDERGVEWGEALTDLSRQTHWSTERYWCAFTEWNGTVDIADTLTVYHVSPEQAVEATLGRGTCKVVSKPCDMWECECGKAWWHGGAPSYCPSCGRKVEE